MNITVETPVIDAYVTQMSDDGHLVETDDGYLLSWDALYETMRSPAYFLARSRIASRRSAADRNRSWRDIP